MSAKKRDNFFTKPKKQKLKFQSGRPPHSTGEHFRPSQSGSGDFFVKPSSNRLSEDTPVKKNRDQEPAAAKHEKKPFDKKKYRLQKYSKKYKLQQWEEKRKTAIVRGYYRTLKEDEPKLDVHSIYEQHRGEIDSDNEDVEDKTKEENENNLNASVNRGRISTENEVVPRNSKEKKGKAFKKAYEEFQRIKEEKVKKKEEAMRRKAEREEALQAYKKKKVEKFKKLNRKTKKGQPIMKERIELLLEKIQSNMNE